MSKSDEVLVAIISKKLDFAILRERLWYRIPVNSVEKWVKDRWPPIRRIVLIPTTREKFSKATEINDLFDDSSLEDKLWAEFKRHDIPAERQEFVIARNAASYCVETVVENINRLGGVDEGKVIPRKINLGGGSYQPSLFDNA